MDNGCSDWLGDSPLSWAGEHFSRLIPQPRHKDKLRSYLVGRYPATRATHGIHHYWALGSFNGGPPAALLPTGPKLPLRPSDPFFFRSVSDFPPLVSAVTCRHAQAECWSVKRKLHLLLLYSVV